MYNLILQLYVQETKIVLLITREISPQCRLVHQKLKYFISAQFVNGRLEVPYSGVILPKNTPGTRSIRYH